MAIGVFDSGIGGLSIHKALASALPDADLIYLGDQKNAPYGDKSGEAIVDLTKAGCETLFAHGASLVVLACNTASAVALRRLQSGWLAQLRARSDRRLNILGIIVPTIEAATGLPWEHESERRGLKREKLDIIGIFSTRATARSRVYEIEIDKRRQDLAVFSEACSGLADMIEHGVSREQLFEKIRHHIEALRAKIGRYPDKAILGCTHYELVSDIFAELLPDKTRLIHQPSSVAMALKAYVEHHTDYDIGCSGQRRFMTTGAPRLQTALTQAFWGTALTFETIGEAA
jgi:glutamate racemase